MALKVEDLDFVGTLSAVEDRLRVRRRAEFEDLELAVHWAGMHGEDPKTWPLERQRRGMAKLVQIGGAGTPEVQDLCLAELAIARHCHPLAARSEVADALDLVHRLPECWAVLRLLVCEAWVARRIAVLTRHLSVEEAAYVDRATAPALLGEQPSVALGVCGAKIVEANPALYKARLDAQEKRKYVALGKMNDAGLRHLIAQINAGDAVYLEAMVTRLADILSVRDAAAGRERRCRDERRAAALGLLARPAEAIRLLLEHATDPDLDSEPDSESDSDPDGDTPDGDGDSDEAEHGSDGAGGPVARPGEDETAQDESDPFAPEDAEADPQADGVPDPGPMPAPEDPDAPTGAARVNPEDDPGSNMEHGPEPGAGWVTGLPERFLDVLRSIDPAQLRPRAQLYVHLHQAALATSRATGQGPGGVVRVEDAGPCLPEHLAELLGDALVKVTEVVDLNGVTPVASYVHPQWLKDQVQLLSPRTGFPHSTTISRRVDYDHPDPYRHGRDGSPAPPGQTGLHNSCPLGRYQHRVKTHAGFNVREPGPGTFVWRTPNQQYRLVDDRGTHVLDKTLGRALFAADIEDRLLQLRILRSAERLTIVTSEELGFHLEVADDYPQAPAA